MFLQQSNILKTTSHIALNNVCICTDLNDYRAYASQQCIVTGSSIYHYRQRQLNVMVSKGTCINI